MMARQSNNESTHASKGRKRSGPQAKPRCASIQELKDKTREEAVVELCRRGWLRAGVYFRAALVFVPVTQIEDKGTASKCCVRAGQQFVSEYGPRAEDEQDSPARDHARTIEDAIRPALAHLFSVEEQAMKRARAGLGYFVSEDDARLRRLLQRMQARGILAGRFDARAPGPFTAEQAKLPGSSHLHDPIGIIVPDAQHSRKLLVDAAKREKFLLATDEELRMATAKEIEGAREGGVRLPEGPIMLARRIALLSIVAGWWPPKASVAMLPKQVLEQEEKIIRREIERWDEKAKKARQARDR